MNRSTLNRITFRQNNGKSVRVRPIAKQFDVVNGLQQLPPNDDDWVVRLVAEDGITISNNRTDHIITLGYDQIHQFTTDVARGERFGFLTLHVQLHIKGKRVWLEPTLRPGEALTE